MLRISIVLCIPLALLRHVGVPEPPARTDLYGDPLPEGAIARMGTVELRNPVTGGPTILCSPDGKYLASGGVTSTTRVWNLATGKLVWQTTAKQSYSVPQFFSQDSNALVISGEGIRVFESATGKLLRTLPAHGSPVIGTPDGRLLATHEENGVVTIWNADPEKRVARLAIEDRTHIPAAFIDNGKALMTWSGFQDVTLRQWDVATGKLLKTVSAGSRRQTMCFSPDGRTLAMAMGKEPLRLVDTVTGNERRTLQGEKANCRYGLVFSADSQTLVTNWVEDDSPDDVTISFWASATGKLIRRFRIPRAAQGDFLALSGDSRTLVTAVTGPTIYLWDAVTGKRLHQKPAHEGDVTSLAFTPDSRSLVSCDHDRILAWDAATGRPQWEMPAPPGNALHRGVYQVALTTDGKSVLSGGYDGCLRMRRLQDGREERCYVLQPPENLDPNVGTPLYFALREDGRSTVTWQQMPKLNATVIRIIELASGKELSRRLEKSQCWYQAISPDGRFAVVQAAAGPDPNAPPLPDNAPAGAGGRQLQRYQLEELLAGRHGAALPPHQGGYAGAFSPDSATLATSSYELVYRDGQEHYARQTLHLSEVGSGQEFLAISTAETGDKKNLTRMAFSPDGRTVATVRGDYVIQLWDVATGKELLRHSGFDADVDCLAFAPDGHTLATGHRDSTILIWDVAAATQRSHNADHALTKAELESCWADLAADAREAHVAIWKLIGVPEQAVPMLRDRLRPTDAVPKDRLRQLLADLDSEEFARREAATKLLGALEELAEPALQAALKTNPSLEQRRRIEALLALPRVVRSPEKLRHLRSIQVLEQIGDVAAKHVLAQLAAGAPGAMVTEDAKAALARLSRQ